MSILFPGLSLPKEGENRLALFVGSDGVVDVYRSVGEATPWLEHYVCECDAIELPPHGDLIDRDHLSVVCYTGTEGLEDTFDNGMACCLEYIDTLTPVIPADPEGGADG